MKTIIILLLLARTSFAGAFSCDDPAMMGQQVAASTSGMVASDNFIRADAGTLGGNWTMFHSDMTISGNKAVGTTGNDSGDWWNANSFHNDQYSKITIANIGSSINAAVVVRY